MRPTAILAQEEAKPIELIGDKIEYVVEENKMVAEGNVIVSQEDVKLTSDKLVLFRDTKLVIAEGNVVLNFKNSTIYGEKMIYNFDEMKGDFMGATISADPYYGAGEKMAKIGENQIRMERGYMTTCNLRKPHFRLYSKKIDVYPGEKIVARHVRLLVGKVPVIYLPKYTQDLRDKKPRFHFTPGYDKQWGMYLLTMWRYYFNDDFKGTVHFDAREKKDLAGGVDLDYDLKDKGKGLIRMYYMNERNITSKRFWLERPSPTIERERFKVEWRHQVKVDDKTDAIWQYYKISDSTFLKDYFDNEYEKDNDPSSFFLLTRTLPAGTFSFRTDVRVNRFDAMVERLPEIQYNITNQEIGNTGLYFKNISTYSNLVEKTASPSEVRQNTMRVDTDNEVSYPFKLGFLEIRPYVGGRQTYYSKTKDKTNYDIIRGLFVTGADLSTKFYKVVEVEDNFFGIYINRLRHIVTPSIAYKFTTDPTVPNSKLDSFDSIDDISQEHTITLSLENKLQTKRDNESVDLVRAVVGADFRLKEHAGEVHGFDHVTADLEIKPVDWMSFYWDASFDTTKDRLESSNIDLYLNPKDSKWSFNFGKRFSHSVDDQITTELTYVINPKWKFRTYYRIDIDSGYVKEQEYTISRDLHCWEVDLNFNETRGEGSEIWIIFRLKAFPEIGFDFGSSFNKRKLGSQNP